MHFAVADPDRDAVLAFLEHLERKRRNGAKTRKRPTHSHPLILPTCCCKDPVLRGSRSARVGDSRSAQRRDFHRILCLLTLAVLPKRRWTGIHCRTLGSALLAVSRSGLGFVFPRPSPSTPTLRLTSLARSSFMERSKGARRPAFRRSCTRSFRWPLPRTRRRRDRTSTRLYWCSGESASPGSGATHVLRRIVEDAALGGVRVSPHVLRQHAGDAVLWARVDPASRSKPGSDMPRSPRPTDTPKLTPR